MAKSISRLKLFLSCTSELEAERSLLPALLNEVNQALEDLRGVTIRLIDWRRDIVPGVGTDPQQVINSQAGAYDIYLGLLGTRFGTPTPRAGSGTEDEFNSAYARFRTDPSSLRLLFYFRSGLSGSVLSVDPDQLRRVQEFRERLAAEKGVLFCDFGSTEAFLSLCRGHLTQLVANQWEGAAWKPVPGLEPAGGAAVPALVVAESGTPAQDEEAPGILDLRVEMDEAFAAAMSALAEVSKLMKAGGEADLQWKAEADKVMASGPNPKRAQELVNSKARNFGDRARELRPLTAAFRSASDEFFERMGQLIQLQIDQGQSTVEEMRAGVAKLSAADAAARAARDAYVSIAASLSVLAEPTRDFKTQKRNLKSQVDALSAAIGSWLDRSAALRARLGVKDSEGA